LNRAVPQRNPTNPGSKRLVRRAGKNSQALVGEIDRHSSIARKKNNGPKIPVHQTTLLIFHPGRIEAEAFARCGKGPDSSLALNDKLNHHQIPDGLAGVIESRLRLEKDSDILPRS
jgi:hypothetical protein